MLASLKKSRLPANCFGVTKVNNLKNYLTLKDLRISKGFKTSISFAEACGLNPSTYSQIETGGHTPNPRHKQAIAEVLGVDIEEAFPTKQESKIKLTVIHETPDKLEAMLQSQYGNKLMPRKEVTQ
jgi:transcriptional regulator with XRE-family HTH domain